MQVEEALLGLRNGAGITSDEICAEIFLSTKADRPERSELREVDSNAGAGKKNKQIIRSYF